MLLGTDKPLQEVHDVALVDLDGVTYRGPEAIPSAPPALAAAREAGMRVVYVTNNANRAPETVAEHLSELGMPTTRDEVMTAAQAGAALLATLVPAEAKVLVVGGHGLVTAVTELGFETVASAEDGPDAVIQGFNPDLRWRDLAEVAYAVQGGAVHVATNLDLTIPNERGIAPGNGSLVQAVVQATGAVPPAAGKPEPAMFHLAAAKADAENPMMIGDRLDTDLKGARAAGYPGLLVLTGVDRAREAILATPDMRPSYIAEDLSGLAEAHPAPRLEDGWWCSGDSRARVVDGVLQAEGGTRIDRVRAACSAAWSTVDAGGHIDIEALPTDGVA
ncbi:HAD-IIA family hydrolase [Demequina sp. SYSU T00b26]|uniref:HAD-IIA family hydrolase n=2 Tax=Demequina zhanjiangensis TaxID=3051659 RepID=A0ABT8G1P7_9MICO|nr:HAD-IIA family hydrolase [Demequina sp. SYSU T00b26]MDN4473066.1 HAD-IIA family hydrolase [Demequina sp. SYSU T00b26]